MKIVFFASLWLANIFVVLIILGTLFFSFSETVLSLFSLILRISLCGYCFTSIRPALDYYRLNKELEKEIEEFGKDIAK